MPTPELYRQRHEKKLCGCCGRPNDRWPKCSCLRCARSALEYKLKKNKPCRENEKLHRLDKVKDPSTVPDGFLPCVTTGCDGLAKVSPALRARRVLMGLPWGVCDKCRVEIGTMGSEDDED